MITNKILKFTRRGNEQLLAHESLMRISMEITVRPLFSALLGRTKFWSQNRG